MVDGVSNVDGEAIGEVEGDVDGTAEDEGRNIVKTWVVVML